MMKHKLHYVMRLSSAVVFLIAIWGNPAEARKVCPIYWGISEKEFFSKFPKTTACPSIYNVYGKSFTCKLNDKNICAQQYRIFNEDSVYLNFKDSRLDSVEVFTLDYYKTIRSRMVTKYGNPVAEHSFFNGWEPGSDRIEFVDNETKSKIIIFARGNMPGSEISYTSYAP